VPHKGQCLSPIIVVVMGALDPASDSASGIWGQNSDEVGIVHNS
jgi:hypothetical protein